MGKIKGKIVNKEYSVETKMYLLTITKIKTQKPTSNLHNPLVSPNTLKASPKSPIVTNRRYTQ
jgi:hypothetical protein